MTLVLSPRYLNIVLILRAGLFENHYIWSLMQIRNGMKQTLPIILFVLFVSNVEAQHYKDPKLPVDERVHDLLQRMSPEEKFMQLFMVPYEPGVDTAMYEQGVFGFQMGAEAQGGGAEAQLMSYNRSEHANKNIEKINNLQRWFIERNRLGIPVIIFGEALHGLVADGATVFPQSIALAATWNTPLMSSVADAIAVECAAAGIRQILSPVVNVATDVRWGRTEETYGEDPFLVSEMGVAYVSAFERRGIITTPKHFAANVGDGGRDSYPVHYNERYMREVIFPPFEACIKKGGSRSIMTAYNSYDGTPCSANSFLLYQILRKEWGFTGFVISDAGATGGANVLHYTAADYGDAAVHSMNGGQDVIFQTSIHHKNLFIPHFLDGQIDQPVIDAAVSRVLAQKFELGLFDNPYIETETLLDDKILIKHRELAKIAASEAVVLLKNEGSVLPLSKTIASVAVIGPDADTVRLGGYSGQGNNPVSIYDGIVNLVGGSVKVSYSKGCNRLNTAYVTVPADALLCNSGGKTQYGLLGDYYDNPGFEGKPAFSRIDKQIQFQWTLFSPDPEKLSYDFYSVRWTGKIKAPTTGHYNIGVDGNDGYCLYINGKLLIDNRIKRGRQTITAGFDFVEDHEYDICIEYSEPAGNAWFRLIWDAGVENNDDAAIEDAVAQAAASDVAIVVAGIEEGEFRDRADLGLPGRQEELIHRVAATGKPVVVVLVGGSAITMNHWIDDVDAIIDVWYPGEQGGNAVAEVLFGDYNPAGRLPITFPVSEGQLPLVYNHKPTGRGDDYTNLTGQALFPFGFGLSYTSFSYSKLKLSEQVIRIGDSVVVSVNITNTGKIPGDEVVQLYLHDELATVARPVKELKGFRRIHLLPGETQEVSFVIPSEMLTMYDASMKKTIEPGRFSVMIGASSKDIRQRTYLEVVE